MTEPTYLLDTNICIEVLADADSRPAIRLGQCEEGAVVTSAICFAEVMLGAAGGDASGARKLFGLIRVLPFDSHAALAYARMPFRRGSYDRLIAAHAIAAGLTLVTSNIRDLRDVEGLKIEDWNAP